MGLYPNGEYDLNHAQKILPLIELKYDGNIDDSLAKVELTQTYENRS
jgi:hypothetical protein